MTIRRAQIRVLPKAPVLGLSSLDGTPEKIDGIAVLDRNTIAAVNDTTLAGKRASTTSKENNIGKGKKSQLLLLHVDKPLPLPWPEITICTSSPV